MNKKKTVYILGAGASKTIGLPLQGEMLKKIFELRPRKVATDSSFIDIALNIDEQQLLRLYEEFNKQRLVLADFIVENFGNATMKSEYKLIASVNEDEEDHSNRYNIACKLNVSLEDLFTFFDKIIIGREHFRTYSSDNIQDIHTALRKCIIFTLAYYCIIMEEKENSLDAFAQILLRNKIDGISGDEEISVITMNWDAYLDKKLFRICNEYNESKTRQKILPDLCFYDYSYNQNQKRIVSTQIKAKGCRNIKLLKLHGSINWLICPYCGRVFVDYTYDIAVDEMKNDCFCPLCWNEFGEKAPIMNSMLITPTFLKDLNNLNIKNIWHNALIELTEASKVVFIGYSFPDADFEMRCLLKKAIKPETQIEVVLHESDDPEYYKNILGLVPNSNTLLEKLNLPEYRYNSFFCKDMIKFYYNGMGNYLSTMSREEDASGKESVN
ncbi:MAG: hypothetical protein WCY62_06670 [Clostridia bacterium]